MLSMVDRRLVSSLVSCSFGLAVAAAQPLAPPAAEELAHALQKKYESVRDFSADFVHTYEGGALRKKVTERGAVLIKKPGRMRWTYTNPERKEFISDGRKIYSYLPADRQVIVSDAPPEDQATSAVLFLAGKGNLTRDFTPSHTVVPQAPPNTWALKMVPRKGEPDYEWLTVVFDRDTQQFRLLITVDRQGGTSRFAFSNIKENTGPADTLFAFRIPRGVDVITNGQTAPPRR